MLYLSNNGLEGKGKKAGNIVLQKVLCCLRCRRREIVPSQSSPSCLLLCSIFFFAYLAKYRSLFSLFFRSAKEEGLLPSFLFFYFSILCFHFLCLRFSIYAKEIFLPPYTFQKWNRNVSPPFGTKSHIFAAVSSSHKEGE